MTPTGDGLYKTVAWHPRFTAAAIDQAFDDAEEFCAQMNKVDSVREKEIIREWNGGARFIYWFERGVDRLKATKKPTPDKRTKGLLT